MVTLTLYDRLCTHHSILKHSVSALGRGQFLLPFIVPSRRGFVAMSLLKDWVVTPFLLIPKPTVWFYRLSLICGLHNAQLSYIYNKGCGADLLANIAAVEKNPKKKPNAFIYKHRHHNKFSLLLKRKPKD